MQGRRNPMWPVVTLEAPVLQVKDIKTGESVGYGALQTVSRDSRIAIVGIGYADGFFRHQSGTNSRAGGRMVVKNHFAPVLGRVSMDMVQIDVTDLPEPPAPGDMVEVLGKNITVDDQADIGNTIGYEILTSLKGRYSRSYIETEAPTA